MPSENSIFFPVPVVRDKEQAAFLVEMVCLGNLKS